jgi:hypothetical protein
MTDQIVFPGTLAEALQSPLILPGSRLLLRAGNYTLGNLQCTLSNVTIMPYPGETVTLIALSGYRCLLVNNCHDVILDGLIFDGTHVLSEVLKITDTTANIIVQNCEVKNGTRHGILISGTPTSCQIINNHVHHNGSGGLDHGVYLSSVGGVTVSQNEIDHNTGHGVHAYGSNDAAAYTIERNYVHDDGERGIGVYYGTAYVYNNIIRHAASIGVRASYNLVTAKIYNNTVTHSGGSAMEIANFYNSPTLTITNNLLLDNNYNIDADQSGAVNVSHTSTAAPASDDGGAGIVGSEDGIALAEITVDYGGNARANPPTCGATE